MADKEENKKDYEEKLIPIYDDDAALGEKPRGTVDNEDFNKSDTIPGYNGGTLEKEFAEAAKDGTLYERYSEYLKRYEGMLRNPDLKQIAKAVKSQISQLKAAYFDAAGLSRKICPECGQIHEKNARFRTCHGSEMYVVGQCRSCGADLSSAQGYSAINSCPKCGAELTAPQKRIINGILVKTPAKTKYVCSKCGKVYDSAIKHCQDCGSKILTMQCGKCGEVLRQNEEGIFDKYCPVCGMLNPAEAERKKREEQNRKLEEERRKKQAEAEKRRLEAEKIKQKKKRIVKVTIAVLCIALALSYAVWKGKDSSTVPAKNVPTTTMQAAAQQYNVGDKISFGSYPFYEDGRKKDIEWIILDIDADNNALVISEYALDRVNYNEKYEDVTWKKSTIREWLNKDFLNNAFTDEEQSKIIESQIENKDNAEHNTKGGDGTHDKLFLLSIDEATNKYFNSQKSRIAYPTPYAESRNSVNGISSYVWWWLRSPGTSQNKAASVRDSGGINSSGSDVNSNYGAVRPVFRINLSNL